MKRSVFVSITLALLALAILSCASKSAGDASQTSVPSEPEIPRIKVSVTGVDQGKSYLIGTYTDQRYRVDTAVIENGKAIFDRNKPYQQGFYYILFPNNKFVQCLIGTDQTFEVTTDINNLIMGTEFTGSLDNELLYDNLKFQKKQEDQYKIINQRMKNLDAQSKEFQDLEKEKKNLQKSRRKHLAEIFKKYPDSFFTAFKNAGQNPELQDVRKPNGDIDTVRQVVLFRKAFWDNVDFSDARLLYTPVIANKLNRYITELTTQQPDSINTSARELIDRVLDHKDYFQYFANWITIKYEPTKTSLMDAEAVFVYMVENYFTYDRAFWSDSVEVYALQQRAYEMSASLVGKKGPDVRAKNPDGEFKSIYEIEDPYVVVYMFNPDCEHCAIETPKLIQFHKKWKPQGVEVFAIAVDTDDTEWRTYVAEKKLPWINVFDPTNRAIYAKYFVNITPEVYVLNEDRTIIGKNLKVHQIETVINRDKRRKSAG